MSDLVAFIKERLAEDEAAARVATNADDEWEAYGHAPAQMSRIRTAQVQRPIAEVHDGIVIGRPLSGEDVSGHIVRHDPARVLRGVEAQRAIVAAYRPATGDPHPGQPCTESVEHDPEGREWEDSQGPCERHVAAMEAQRGTPHASEHVLRCLAAVYSDHPDFNPEWSTT